MHDAGDGNDEEADDDGGNSNIEGVLAKPPGAIIVTVIIAVPRHDREDQGHDVDRVRRTKAGEYSQTKVATEWRWRFLFLYRTMVKRCAPTQGAFPLRIEHS